LRICTAWPPSRVTLLPPSMTVSLVVESFIVAVTGIVIGASPQLKVMAPALATAALRAANVQLAGVPVPTAVELETSAGFPLEGTPALHEPLGFPAVVIDPPEPPVPTVAPDPPDPPVDDVPELEPQPTVKRSGRSKASEARMSTSLGGVTQKRVLFRIRPGTPGAEAPGVRQKKRANAERPNGQMVSAELAAPARLSNNVGPPAAVVVELGGEVGCPKEVSSRAAPP